MKSVYLAYFDESGDSGTTNSPTSWFVLVGVLVHERAWLDTLNALVYLRRDLRNRYGIAPRDELKGADFRRGRGAFDSLNIKRSQRMQIYADILQFESQLNIQTFAVAVQKAKAAAKGWDARYAAWTFALQRLHRFCLQEDDRVAVFPDQGHGFFIRQRIRHMRRFHTVPSNLAPGFTHFEIERVLEDPNDRRSQDSYFVQLADLNAYAAHRSKYVHPMTKVPTNLWDKLAGATADVRLKAVSRRGPPGIVVYAP